MKFLPAVALSFLLTTTIFLPSFAAIAEEDDSRALEGAQEDVDLPTVVHDDKHRSPKEEKQKEEEKEEG